MFPDTPRAFPFKGASAYQRIFMVPMRKMQYKPAINDGTFLECATKLLWSKTTAETVANAFSLYLQT